LSNSNIDFVEIWFIMVFVTEVENDWPGWEASSGNAALNANLSIVLNVVLSVVST